MGVQPSKTELFLPSQTLRECHPDRCWCDRPYHRSSRYVYVERGGDGREHYQDPVDLMQQFMTGGGGGAAFGQMPWKDPRSWTVRDYEKLGEVMEEWASREYGKTSSGGRSRGGNTGYPPWPGAQQGGGGYWDGDYGGRHHGSGGRRSSSRRYVGWDQFEDLKASFHRMAEQHQRHISEQDAFLFGSDADRRKEQYRQNMLNQLKEMMPQLAEMMTGMPYPPPPVPAQTMPGMQQHYPPQMAGMPPHPMMNGAVPGMQMPTPGAQMSPQMQQQAAAAAAAMQGMGVNMNMNPMAATAAMQAQINPMMMAGGGANMPMMNNAMMEPPPSMSRRARRRNGFAIDDGFDDEYDDFRPRRGFKRRGGGGGAGNWRDEDDMLGGYADMRGPRGGPPSRPPDFRPGNGGMTFDEPDRFRSSMPTSYVPPTPAPGHDHIRMTRPSAALAPESPAFSPPLRRPGYSAADAAAVNEARRRNMMPTAETIYDESLDVGMDNASLPTPYSPTSYRTRPDFASSAGIDLNTPQLGRRHTNATAYNDFSGTTTTGMAENAPFTSAATGVAADAYGASGLKSAMKRNVSFDSAPRESAHLTRPRQEEAARAETSAGAMPDKRDGLGTL
ncbi:hypothetical protein Slin15195_G054860 [Septoria linicola]|uniref:Uncharacterized protein n=1 Tax=Septoria linicola TaxID=215465 RepID=A0A9Q9AUD0_9PEZI|nr:hypothetical protein Slin14017_G070720 [Septoria linicola]USW52167.1 hypothetical protein Slin15195_G054860 [Septoria linicola]